MGDLNHIFNVHFVRPSVNNVWSWTMIRVRPDGYILVIAVAIIGILLLAFGAKSAGDPARQGAGSQVPLIPSLQGPDLFRSYCAPCHGGDGKGYGPVAPALNSKPPDLTTISKGRGGVFPEKWVRELIAGRPISDGARHTGNADLGTHIS
jgi:mono/diheme cytochrome c family protein